MHTRKLQKGSAWGNGHLGVFCVGGGDRLGQNRVEDLAASAPFRGFGRIAHLHGEPPAWQGGEDRGAVAWSRGVGGTPGGCFATWGPASPLGELTVLLALAPTLAPESLLGFGGEGAYGAGPLHGLHSGRFAR